MAVLGGGVVVVIPAAEALGRPGAQNPPLHLSEIFPVAIDRRQDVQRGSPDLRVHRLPQSEQNRIRLTPFLIGALDSDFDGLEEAVLSLKALSLRPLRSWSSPLHGLRPKPSAWTRLFGDAASRVIPAHLRAPTQQFLWQKNPFSVGEGEKDETGRLEATGVDFLLPYWFSRRHGFIPPPAAAAERP